MVDNRLRRELAVEAVDKLIQIDYVKDDINMLIDDAYNLLEDAIDQLTAILDEEEN